MPQRNQSFIPGLVSQFTLEDTTELSVENHANVL